MPWPASTVWYWKEKALCRLEDRTPEACLEGSRHFAMRETTGVKSIKLLQTKESFCLHQLSLSCPFQTVALCLWITQAGARNPRVSTAGKFHSGSGQLQHSPRDTWLCVLPFKDLSAGQCASTLLLPQFLLLVFILCVFIHVPQHIHGSQSKLVGAVSAFTLWALGPSPTEYPTNPSFPMHP